MEETADADNAGPVPQGQMVAPTVLIEKGGDTGHYAIMPWPLFAVQLAYLLVLLLLMFAYAKSSGVRAFFPDPIGFVPLSVPWWGALGAVTVALFGIFFHNQNWNPSYNYWYCVRPVTGAVLEPVMNYGRVLVGSGYGQKNIHKRRQ